MLRFSLLIAIFFSTTVVVSGQKNKLKPYKLGFSYAYGVQGGALLHENDYNYKTNTIALQFFYPLKRGKFNLDLLIEPTIGFAQHQLLNLYYIKDTEPNFEAKRAFYTQNRHLTEILMIGNLIIRRKLFKGEELYALFGFGPMTISKATERLARGYAFVSTIGIGLQTRINNKLFFNVSGKLRHMSNAELKQPNAGINTASIGFGFNFEL